MNANGNVKDAPGDSLTPLERRRLAHLEEHIEASQSVMLSTWAALAEVHEKRLYRETDRTFENYLKRRWPTIAGRKIGRRRAYQLLAAAEVVDDVNHGAQPLENERQARPLTRLAEAEDRRGVWDSATASGHKPTGAELDTLVDEFLDALPPAERARRETTRRYDDANRRDGDRERVAQVERLAGRMRAVHAGLTDRADRLDAALDKYLAILQENPPMAA